MTAWELLLMNLAIRRAEREERRQPLFGDALIARIRQRWGR